jgi:chaperonin cofactor prefoldin
MAETASRNLCETLAKVQEKHQYRYPIQKLIDQRQQVEAELAESMSTQCKKIQKWDEMTRIDLEIWLLMEVDNILDPKQFSRMLGTNI